MPFFSAHTGWMCGLKLHYAFHHLLFGEIVHVDEETTKTFIPVLKQWVDKCHTLSQMFGSDKIISIRSKWLSKSKNVEIITPTSMDDLKIK